MSRAVLLSGLALLLVVGPLAQPVLAVTSITLTSPSPQTDGSFGYSVAVGDGVVVVGAPAETASFTSDAGHAYIFDATTGALVSTLISPNVQLDGQFGTSVGVASSGYVVVGAPYETASGDTYAGHAYIFSTTGTLLETLTSPNVQAGGYFGFSVGGGTGTVVVGAPNEKVGALVQAGNAYTFTAATGALKATLASANPASGGLFGTSVSINSNIALVGAPGETSSGGTGSGNAYDYNAATGVLMNTLVNPTPQFGSQFGAAVSTRDGVAVVGAYGQQTDGINYAGAADMYNAKTGALISTLTSATPQAYGYFGSAVGMGVKAAMVGAHGETAAGLTEAGNAYAFKVTTGALLATATSPAEQAAASFGQAVGIAPAGIVVGAPGESPGGVTYAGQAYIFFNLF